MSASWFGGLLGKIYSSSVGLEIQSGINFARGIRATKNAATKLIDVDLTGTVESITTGLSMPLLPQVEFDAQTTDATVTEIARVPCGEDTSVLVAVYLQAFATAHASETLFEVVELWRSHAGTSDVPAQLYRQVTSEANPLAVAGVTFAADGAAVAVSWTGDAGTTLRVVGQAAYLSRPCQVPA